MDKDKEVQDLIDVREFHCPRFNELPHLPLYKDQVIKYIEDVLQIINFETNEKLLTPTMVNNYVKQKVVAPPEDKKYNEKHIAYLIVVCVLKKVFSLTEICKLIRIQIETCPIEQAYDCFCTELENALKRVFITRNFPKSNFSMEISEGGEVVRSVVISFAHRIYIQKYLLDK